jgi:hypothetical protein
MRWKGEYDDPPFATHGENIGVHTFLWSDGQMTMVSWGAQQKEIKVLAVCVCACTTPTQCPAFREPKRTTIVWNVQGIYKQLRDCTHIGGSHRNVLALTSRQNTYQHRLAFSAGIDSPT